MLTFEFFYVEYRVRVYSCMRRAGRAQDLPHLLAAVTRFSSWSDYADHTTAIRGRLQGVLGAKTKAVIPGVANGGAAPDTEHAESARWLRALSMESRLLRWIACSDFGLLHDRFIEAKKPWLENSTFAYWWRTIEDMCGEGAVLDPLCHGAGVHDGLVGGSPCRKGGAWSGGRPHCAALARGRVSHRTGAPRRSASFGPKTEASPCRWMDAIGASR